MSTDGTKFEKCPICQCALKVVGKYETVYVYQCTGRKCRRKWNLDALEANKHEKTRHDKK